MPCDSSYMERSGREKALHRTAQLYVYVLKLLGKPVPERVQHGAKDYYGHDKQGKEVDCVADLCKTINEMSPESRDKIIYNARDKMARKLADWWEEHQEADRQREARVRAKAAKRKLKNSALSKLTPEEREALEID